MTGSKLYSANVNGSVVPCRKLIPVTTVASGSMDSGSLGSPSRGSDMVPWPNSSGRIQHIDVLGDDLESPDITGVKTKKRGSRTGDADKGGRGLRHFSMKVCEKVESKVRTTYNEVADELVAEFANPESMLVSPDQQQYDEKNIRRRVYDALNVLMAMDIISKEKKEIQWKGLPSMDLNDVEKLKAESMQIMERIDRKSAYLQELQDQIVGIQNLIQRNESKFRGTGSIPMNGVALPFILVQTQPHATVEVEISEDMQLVHFDFNSTPFELHDDAYVLKEMGICGSLQSGGPSAPGFRDCKNSSLDKEMSPISGVYHHATSPYSGPYQQCCIPGKGSSSPPLPAILKARVKHDN